MTTSKHLEFTNAKQHLVANDVPEHLHKLGLRGYLVCRFFYGFDNVI